MRKKPDKLDFAGQANFPADDPNKPGLMCFEIRVAIRPDGKLQWWVGIEDGFVERCKIEDLEWRQRLVERLSYMTEQTVSKALGVEPH